MSDFDLRELSAPIEALRPDVKAAYIRLDSRWEEIANHLKKLAIPCVIGYAFWESPDGSPDCEQLEWRKWRGSKRFCITSYIFHGAGEEENIKPYEEWSAEQRLNMLHYIPYLFKNAEVQIKQFVKKTSELEADK